MATRTTKQYSDRGSIKDIQKSVEEGQNLPFTPFELRIRDLYENALVSRNQELIDSLGFIVMSGPIKDPVSIYRHREYVKSLAAKLADKVEVIKQDVSQIVSNSLGGSKDGLSYKQATARNTILAKDTLYKKAATYYGTETTIELRSFRRVSEE